MGVVDYLEDGYVGIDGWMDGLLHSDGVVLCVVVGRLAGYTLPYFLPSLGST